MDPLCTCGYTDTIIVGATVPEEVTFDAFHNEEIKKVSFKELRGKWVVLFFYPGDFTFVCPTELSEMQQLKAEFEKEGVELVSMSTDSVYVHKAWHDESPAIKELTYLMGSDQTLEIAALFGVLVEEEGVALRGTFIISPEGVVKAIEINDNSIGRCGKETLRKLKASKYVSENPGNVCPASWDTGAETLKPGLDLVGKI